MIHCPRRRINMNSPCMKNIKCTKHFPKEYLLKTQTLEDGYPKCRRRKIEDGGQHFTMQKRNVEYTIDNRWVVQYCPLLSKICNAHINVEFYNSVKSIKYIYVNISIKDLICLWPH